MLLLRRWLWVWGRAATLPAVTFFTVHSKVRAHSRMSKNTKMYKAGNDVDSFVVHHVFIAHVAWIFSSTEFVLIIFLLIMFFETIFSACTRALCIFIKQPSELPCSFLEWEHLFSSDFWRLWDEGCMAPGPSSFLCCGPALYCLLLGTQGIFTVTFEFFIIYVDN